MLSWDALNFLRWNGTFSKRSFYLIKTHTPCALLHNHIKKSMYIDPFENEVPKVIPLEDNDIEWDFIDYSAISYVWNQFRDNLA